jgi:hypothetical protein
MDNIELFKQALVEGVNRRIDRGLNRARGYEALEKDAPEHIDEFMKSQEGEQDSGFYIYIGDKHYFEFELVDDDFVLLDISEIEYS